MTTVRRPSGAAARSDVFWALKDVSLDVQVGEVVGIIGRNGAGKSTLLKVLSRITEPTTGSAEIRGRVGSLLEVGTGFHPELTGRENVYLNGAMLGMRKTEISRKFDEITAFAEVERFIDTPVKHYSSGMYTRLAFAVAAHLEPEILMIDEVLAVGDAAFQKKCLGRMGDVARHGRTVLFVSHNMTAVQALCNRVIWLRDGEKFDEGRPRDVVSRYLSTAANLLAERTWPILEEAPGSDKVRIRRAAVRPDSDSHSHASEITVRTPIILEFDYVNLSPGTHLNLSIVVFNEEDIPVFNSVPISEPTWHGRPFPAGLFRSRCFIPADLLNDGMHRIQLMVVQDQGVVLSRHDDILTFEVQDDATVRGSWFGDWIGAVRPKLQWSTELLSDSADSLLMDTQRGQTVA